MAQLNNLIVTGSSRFLNDIKCQGVQTPFQNGGFMCGDASAATDFTVILQGVIATSANNNTIAIMPNSQDITNTGTWNGTNTSLKTAVTNARTTVTQTATTTNANYEVLFSGTADNTTRTEGAGKSNGFIYNPNKNSILVGTLKSGATIGTYSTAFGVDVEASGDYSHAEGAVTTASGEYSHAEGCGTIASDSCSHAEGDGTEASGFYSHAEGVDTIASGLVSHAEGDGTTASGYASHAEGCGTEANHKSQHVFGECNIADPSTAAADARGNYVEIVGNGTADDARSNARTLDWSGNEWLARSLVVGTLKSGTSIGSYSSAIGGNVEASGNYSVAEGNNTSATGYYGHAEGTGAKVTAGYGGHAEGCNTTVSGHYGHAEGNGTIANHANQHVFGEYNIEDPSTANANTRGTYVEIVGNGTASGSKSNARTLDWSGNEWLQRSLTIGSRGSTSTYGVRSLAVGSGHTCSGHDSVAEGDNNTVTGNYSHVEGTHSTVDTDYGHAEGQYTTASGYYSHVEGDHTIANHNSQHVFGTYNIADPSTTSGAGKGTYIEIVGNGTSSTRSNARTLNWSGNEWIAGTLTQGSSIEIKKNVADMTQEDGDKILNLHPIVFDYKSSEKDIQAERGFIAEEVKEVIPNLVTDKVVNDEGETVAPASLNYIAMIPYLVKVCQRQQEEIDELKSLISEK